jgi:hypothetical protein
MNMDQSLEALIQRRDELRDRIKAIHADLGRGLDKDYEEQSIQLENLEVLQEIVRVAENELRDVEIKIAAVQDKNAG